MIFNIARELFVHTAKLEVAQRSGALSQLREKGKDSQPRSTVPPPPSP
jgi:hypothetical protein